MHPSGPVASRTQLPQGPVRLKVPLAGRAKSSDPSLSCQWSGSKSESFFQVYRPLACCGRQTFDQECRLPLHARFEFYTSLPEVKTPRFLFSAGHRRPLCRRSSQWSRRDSNPRPSACKADALPTELRPLGIWPAKLKQRTRRLQRRFGSFCRGFVSRSRTTLPILCVSSPCFCRSSFSLLGRPARPSTSFAVDWGIAATGLSLDTRLPGSTFCWMMPT